MRIDRQFIDLQSQIDRMTLKVELKMLKNYKGGLDDLRVELGKVFSKYEYNGKLTYAEMVKYSRLISFQRVFDEVVDDIIKQNSKVVKSSLKDVYIKAYDETREIIQDAAKKTIRGIIRDDVIQASLQNPISGLTLNKRLEVKRAEIITNIQQQVTQGLIKGESYKQMSDRLKSSLEKDATKAMKTVRTESHRVMEDSKYQSLTSASNQGVSMTKTWVTSRDERVRVAGEGGHTRMDGTTIPFNEEFINDETDGHGPAPGQMGTPEDDINCRCIFVVNIE